MASAMLIASLRMRALAHEGDQFSAKTISETSLRESSCTSSKGRLSRDRHFYLVRRGERLDVRWFFAGVCRLQKTVDRLRARVVAGKGTALQPRRTLHLARLAAQLEVVAFSNLRGLLSCFLDPVVGAFAPPGI
jgi:hypothetical protein